MPRDPFDGFLLAEPAVRPVPSPKHLPTPVATGDLGHGRLNGSQGESLVVVVVVRREPVREAKILRPAGSAADPWRVPSEVDKKVSGRRKDTRSSPISLSLMVRLEPR